MTPGLMTPELFWLTLTVILTGLLWVPYILNRMTVRGLFGTMANPRAAPSRIRNGQTA